MAGAYGRPARGRGRSRLVLGDDLEAGAGELAQAERRAAQVTRSRSIETSERMSAAQIAVQKKLSRSRRVVSQSVISRTTAFTRNNESPKVSSASGSVRRRRMVPATTLTSPNNSDTQR